MTIQIRLNETQVDRLSEVLGNLGLVFFASLVVPALSQIQQRNTSDVFVGITGSLAFIGMSLFILRKNKI
ncbi:hypothetical protein HY086_06305 [Candidatus Gottesmanbacteria bacterium]|nr:hypothetical protein [Candidatus Gottesmanbacteria bacterium]